MQMIELQRLASLERPITRPAISATRTIVIDAPVAKVWQVATDVRSWANWYPYLKNAELGGSFAAGSPLTYGGLIKHNLMIARVKECSLVMIYGKLSIYSAITRWDFSPLSKDRTSVTFSETSEGVLLGTLYSDEKLARHLDDWLASLKTEAERR